MPTILDEIVSRKHREVALARERVPTAALAGRLGVAPEVRDFFAAVAAPGGMRLIAEFKRKSPSAGEIRPGAVIEEIVRGYAAAGASALSVLTDGFGFGGSLVDLEDARRAVQLPVLRKEFVVDRYQVVEARAHGADAVLLIAECLDDCLLKSLYREVLDLGMTPLVELHSEEHLSRVLDLGATLVGINNRDLRTMTTKIEHCMRLAEMIEDTSVLVAESGIRTPDDLRRLRAHGIHIALVGEHLMRQPDPGLALKQLLS